MMRRTPLKRTAWNRRPRVNQPEPADVTPPAPARPPAVPARRAVMTPANDAVYAVPKGPRARPGKAAPTAEERAWLDAIVAYGCIACRLDGLPPRPTSVHHILRGGVRMGHLFSLPLCDPGHHQGGEALGLVSRHPWKARFEERYGTEEKLLERLQRTLLKGKP